MTPAMQHLTMFGARGLNAFVFKIRGKWIVEIYGVQTPTTFARKTDALKHAEARIYAEEGYNSEPWQYKSALRPGKFTRIPNTD